MTHQDDTRALPDRIEREILIEAPVDVVWELVAEPGWWINDGTLVEHRIEQREDHVVVHDPTHGAFPLRVVSHEAPHYAAYRWMGEDGDDSGTSLVEFWITPTDRGALLRVVESGLASMPGTVEQRRAMYEDNLDGWKVELAAAQRHLDPERVEVVRFLPVPPQQVWPLLATVDGLRGWYAFDGAEGSLLPGCTVRFTWREHGTFLARVESVQAPTRLTLRLAVEPGAEPVPGASTVVSLSVRAAGEGSLVVIEQDEVDVLQPCWGHPAEFAATERTAWRAGLQLLSERVTGRGAP